MIDESWIMSGLQPKRRQRGLDLGRGDLVSTVASARADAHHIVTSAQQPIVLSLSESSYSLLNSRVHDVEYIHVLALLLV